MLNKRTDAPHCGKHNDCAGGEAEFLPMSKEELFKLVKIVKERRTYLFIQIPFSAWFFNYRTSWDGASFLYDVRITFVIKGLIKMNDARRYVQVRDTEPRRVRWRV